MELSCTNFRTIIFPNSRRGLGKQESIDGLKSLYGDEAPSYSTVKNWSNEFSRGPRPLKDELRKGRRQTIFVPENIDAVSELIMQDHHVTTREIEAALGISSTSIHSILYVDLAVKKDVCSRWILDNLTIAQNKFCVDWCKEMYKKYVCIASKDVYKIVIGDESWIYAYDSEMKQQPTMWVFEDEPNPTKVGGGRSTWKEMVAWFFGATGHVETVPLEHRRTVNYEWYIRICLSEVFEEILKMNKRRLIIVHHDNRNSHTLAQSSAFLTGQNVKLMICQKYIQQPTYGDWDDNVLNW
ncbi:uncharacterized protein [Lepeophtheirus salmonis]|uniref:uncharacterized protein n=1 Tax=Lepeophtheirus salmonis TaxID=72036 RepID=UPI001AE30D3E|nr:uncharacterized protein LOC121130437 [Lepeophtheirus salmonis]